MNNLIARQLGGLSQATAYFDAMEYEANKADDGASKPILKLNKDDGEFYFGEDDTPLGDCDIAINPLTIKRGYIAFMLMGNEIAATVDGDDACFTYLLNERYPTIDELPETEEELVDKRNKVYKAPEYKEFYEIEMVIVSGEHKGTHIVYKSPNNGAQKFSRQLLREIDRERKNLVAAFGDASEMSLEDMKIVPIIELYSGSYPNKRYGGDTYFPKYEVLEFVGLDTDEFSQSEETEEKSSKKKAKSAKKTKKKAPAKRGVSARADHEQDSLDEEVETVEEAEEVEEKALRKEKPTRGRGRSRAKPQEIEEVEEAEEVEEPTRTRGRRRTENVEEAEVEEVKTAPRRRRRAA